MISKAFVHTSRPSFNALVFKTYVLVKLLYLLTGSSSHEELNLGQDQFRCKNCNPYLVGWLSAPLRALVQGSTARWCQSICGVYRAPHARTLRKKMAFHTFVIEFSAPSTREYTRYTPPPYDYSRDPWTGLDVLSSDMNSNPTSLGTRHDILLYIRPVSGLFANEHEKPILYNENLIFSH